MSQLTSKASMVVACVLAAVCFIYGSHLHNGFHFDDSHAVVQNPYLRDIHNVPRFFADTSMTSVLPANRAYRPVLFASLAIDYRLGNGLTPLWFHLSTLVWFLAQIVLVFVLCRQVFDRISPETNNSIAAAFGAAVFGLHPVMAETVNYVIQRAELQSTLGVVAGIAIFAGFPRVRRYGLYLLPAAVGILSKPTVLVFPVLLFLYCWMIEEETLERAARLAVPSMVLTVLLGLLTAKMTPAEYNPGAVSAWGYRISQPFAMLRYFVKFFVPTGLSADTDHQAFSSLLDDGAIQGFLFLAALISGIRWAAKRREWRPVAFGLAWFVVALLPTALMPLAEVENDHRMFFSFVGLAIAAPWTVVLWLRRHPLPRAAVVTASLLLLAGFGYGAWERCEVWKTDETLWRDVTVKSPHNGRGLMNYGLVLMERGDFGGASAYFERAAGYLPNYYILEINRGIVNGVLRNGPEAERRFRRANQLAPLEASPKYYYARWLSESGRWTEAAELLRVSIARNPAYLDSYYLLMQAYGAKADGDGVRSTAQQMLARFPSDATAQDWLRRAAAMASRPEALLNQSLAAYQAGRYADCIAFARKALELRPGYADAWNNIAAAYNALAQWDQGIRAGEKALEINPNHQLARNNLAWARLNKAKSRG